MIILILLLSKDKSSRVLNSIESGSGGSNSINSDDHPGYNIAVAELAGLLVTANEDTTLRLLDHPSGPEEVLTAISQIRLSDEQLFRLRAHMLACLKETTSPTLALANTI
ncbi:unnamed protein product [Protopolystoma xenopodis]|uniref:Uncharacterized protein n=1 Tax=Protopolystoma xenopodis TaxID=117903 RepID=A0A3S5ACF8_9PLAT|nr:unnamed protein product [Protopolystoma xenopodis]